MMSNTALFTRDEIQERERNRREYPRVPYEKPMQFTICLAGKADDLYEGFSLNISQSGMLFSTKHVIPLSSIIVFETDIDTLSKCIAVESQLFYIQDYLFGKVVRLFRHHDSDYSTIGLNFIKQHEEQREDVREAIRLISAV